MQDMFAKMITYVLLGAIFVGQGMAAANMNGAQGKMMARRAAIVDLYRQAGGSQGLEIVGESFDGHIYKVEAVRN